MDLQVLRDQVSHNRKKHLASSSVWQQQLQKLQSAPQTVQKVSYLSSAPVDPPQKIIKLKSPLKLKMKSKHDFHKSQPPRYNWKELADQLSKKKKVPWTDQRSHTRNDKVKVRFSLGKVEKM